MIKRRCQIVKSIGVPSLAQARLTDLPLISLPEKMTLVSALKLVLKINAGDVSTPPHTLRLSFAIRNELKTCKLANLFWDQTLNNDRFNAMCSAEAALGSTMTLYENAHNPMCSNERKFIMAKHARRKAQQRKKNNNLWIGGVVALVILGISVVWLTSRGTTETSSYPSEITMEEAVAKRDSGAFILDVRQPEEWNEIHVPDSTLIPLSELASRVNELPKDQEIVVVCRSGNRSAQGRDILLEAGFAQVTSMAGGLTQWKAAGYPTVSGP